MDKFYYHGTFGRNVYSICGMGLLDDEWSEIFFKNLTPNPSLLNQPHPRPLSYIGEGKYGVNRLRRFCFNIVKALQMNVSKLGLSQ